MKHQDHVLFATIASAYYTKTRDEIIERIKLRDSAMSLFLSSISIIGSVYGGLIAFLGADTSTIFYGSYLLVVICLQCRSAASVISQHHVLIGAGEHFLVTEFDKIIRQKSVNIPQWDLSQTMLESKNFSILSRAKGHQMLIVQVAGISAMGFIVLQLIFGPHFNVIQSIFGLNSDNVTSGNILEVVFSVFATFIALLAVNAAHKTLSNASDTRRKYLKGMQLYVDEKIFPESEVPYVHR